MLDKYKAPLRKGYEHVGNHVSESGDEALKYYGKLDGMIAVPFYPDGKPDGHGDVIKVKWAVYRWVGV